MTIREKNVLSVDGVQRTQNADKLLADAFASCFNTPAGVRVLDYLKSRTVNMVAGPEVSNEHLRHLEGQRFTVSQMTLWIERNEQLKRKVLKNG